MMNEEDPDFQKGLHYKQTGNYEQAKEIWLKAAKQGNINALHSLGLLFYEGVGFKKDYKIAIEYWEAAGEKKHPKSLANLGLLYFWGEGVTQDLKKALHYFEQSSKLGLKEADEKIFYIKKQLKSQEFHHYIKATQSGAVRLDCDNTPADVKGLCTDSLFTCLCFIVIPNTKKRFSLVHTAMQADADEIIKECRWVGDPCTIYIIKGSYYNNPEHEKFRREKTTLIARLESAVENSPLSIKVDSQYLANATWAVRLSRAGEITLLDIPTIEGCSAPNSSYRNAINMLNTAPLHTLDIQYDNGWTTLPKLTPKARNLKIDSLSEEDAWKVTHLEKYNKFSEDFEEKAKKYNKLGLELYKKNDFSKSIEEFSKALDFCDLLMDEIYLNEKSSIHYNIGSAYSKIKQWDKALIHLELARDIKMKINVGNEQIKKVEQKISEAKTFLTQYAAFPVMPEHHHSLSGSQKTEFKAC